MFSDIIQLIKDIYSEKKIVSLHEPVFIRNEKKYINNCIDSTFVSSVGEYVDKFEKSISSFTEIPYSVACVNGTSALHAALVLCDVKTNDEVITQALTFVATANAISYCCAHPVFIDSDKDRLGMSANSLEQFLYEFAEVRLDGFCYNKKTGRIIKACVPMHVFGHPVDIDAIATLCEKYHIQLVEDCAESLGSWYKGKHTGSQSRISILSFNGNKTVTTGGGGMLMMSDELLAKKAKHLTTTAKIPHAWEFVHDQIGYNYRLPNLNAALGLAQMEYIQEIIESKRVVADIYRNFFKKRGIHFVDEPLDSKSNFWLNSIMFESKSDRDLFLNETNSNNVMTRPVWALMPEMPHFSSCQKTHLEEAISIRDRLVNLPSSCRLK